MIKVNVISNGTRQCGVVPPNYALEEAQYASVEFLGKSMNNEKTSDSKLRQSTKLVTSTLQKCQGMKRNRERNYSWIEEN